VSQLLDELLSLRFWIAVVVVGILVNLASVWLKSRLDGIGGAFSTNIRLRNQARANRRAVTIARVAADPQEQILLAFREMRMHLWALSLFVLGGATGAMAAAARTFIRLDGDKWIAPWIIRSSFLVAALALTVGMLSYSMR